MATTIRAFEGGRGVAAMFVALCHLGIGAGYVSAVRNGHLFVDLFFVLSGFVISAAYSSRLNAPTDLVSFMLRRFGRLFPLLVFSAVVFFLAANGRVIVKAAAIAAGFGASFAHPGALDYALPGWAELASMVTMTHALGFLPAPVLNPISWSISTEFYAYVLFALICLSVPRRARIPLFAAVAILGYGITVWGSIEVHDCLRTAPCLDITYDYGFPRCLTSFFLGALTFEASRHVRRGHVPLQLASAALIAAVFVSINTAPVLTFALPLLFASAVLALSTDRGPVAGVLKTRTAQALGQRSYSIYMMHPTLLLLFHGPAKAASGAAAVAVLLAFVAALVVLTGWTYRFVEDPMRRYFNRLAAAGQRAPPVAAVPAR